MAVMTGPFDLCTTARSGDRLDFCAGWSDASTLAGSTGFEQPVTTAAALPKKAALASSRRLMGAVAFLDPVEHRIHILSNGSHRIHSQRFESQALFHPS